MWNRVRVNAALYSDAFKRFLESYKRHFWRNLCNTLYLLKQVLFFRLKIRRRFHFYNNSNNNIRKEHSVYSSDKRDASVWFYLWTFHISHISFIRSPLTYPAGYRDGAVVRALASRQCGPSSIPGLGVICGLSLLVLYSAPRGFLRVLRFPLSSKTNIWLDLLSLFISIYSVPN